MLRTEARVGLPAGIEEDKNRTDVVLCRDRKKLVETPARGPWIVQPPLVLQKDAYGVHPDGLGHAQLFVIQRRIECGVLKHLQFVDGIGRHVVGPDQPRLLLVPGVRSGRIPARRVLLCIAGGGCGRQDKHRGRQPQI